MRQAPGDGQEARIVLAEPSPTRALRIAHGFESRGWTVHCVHDADEALDLAGAGADAVIAAEHPGAGTGVALCRRLRAHAPTAHAAVMILSGSEDDAAELASFEAGADDHVRESDGEPLRVCRAAALLRRAARRCAQAGAAGAGLRVLVVDDSMTYREFVAMKLERAGCDVAQVDSGGAGLRAMAAQPFHVVILDMNLPDMRGAVMCERFAAARDALDPSPWILMLTGGESLDEMSAVLNAGADEVVGKSRDFRIIEARLNALLRR
jgi:two-component system NtrC family sensor kinase